MLGGYLKGSGLRYTTSYLSTCHTLAYCPSLSLEPLVNPRILASRLPFNKLVLRRNKISAEEKAFHSYLPPSSLELVSGLWTWRQLSIQFLAISHWQLLLNVDSGHPGSPTSVRILVEPNWLIASYNGLPTVMSPRPRRLLIASHGGDGRVRLGFSISAALGAQFMARWRFHAIS